MSLVLQFSDEDSDVGDVRYYSFTKNMRETIYPSQVTDPAISDSWDQTFPTPVDVSCNAITAEEGSSSYEISGLFGDKSLAYSRDRQTWASSSLRGEIDSSLSEMLDGTLVSRAKEQAILHMYNEQLLATRGLNSAVKSTDTPPTDMESEDEETICRYYVFDESLQSAKKDAENLSDDAPLSYNIAIGDLLSDMLQPAQEEATLMTEEARSFFADILQPAQEELVSIFFPDSEVQKTSELKERSPTFDMSAFSSLANDFSSKMIASRSALEESMRPASENMKSLLKSISLVEPCSDAMEPAREEAAFLCREMSKSFVSSSRAVGEAIDPAKEEAALLFQEASMSFQRSFSWRKHP